MNEAFFQISQFSVKENRAYQNASFETASFQNRLKMPLGYVFNHRNRWLLMRPIGKFVLFSLVEDPLDPTSDSPLISYHKDILWNGKLILSSNNRPQFCSFFITSAGFFFWQWFRIVRVFPTVFFPLWFCISKHYVL